ncbi:MAG: hypothetical protein WBA93_29190 [Microcoleaceae cyanobacterium]
MSLSILNTKIPTLGEGYVVKVGYISPSDGAGNIDLRLKSGKDAALSFSPRYSSKAVVLNTLHGG